MSILPFPAYIRKTNQEVYGSPERESLFSDLLEKGIPVDWSSKVWLRLKLFQIRSTCLHPGTRAPHPQLPPQDYSMELLEWRLEQPWGATGRPRKEGGSEDRKVLRGSPCPSLPPAWQRAGNTISSGH